MSDAITITRSTAADSEDVWRLALLDDRRAPVGPALLAYVDGELRAAVGSWTARRSLVRSIRPRSSWRSCGSRHVRRWQREPSAQLGGGQGPPLTSLDGFMKEARYRDGMRVMLPLMPAIVAFGASFGVLARAAGVDSLAALVMSATTFAGSAQFAVVSVLGAGGTAAAAIGAAVLLNARYAPMALAASGAFRGHPVRRLLEAQLLVDESWALSSRGGRFDRKLLLGAGGVLYVGWNAGTAIGVVAGDSLADPATSASTRPSPPCSWRCSRRCCEGAVPARGRAHGRRHRARPHPDHPRRRARDRRHRGLPGRPRAPAARRARAAGWQEASS